MMGLAKKLIDAVIDGKIGYKRIVTRKEVMEYFSHYPDKETGTILSAAMMNRKNDPSYISFTTRLAPGTYEIHRSIILKRKRERVQLNYGQTGRWR